VSEQRHYGPLISSFANERVRFVKSLYHTQVRRKEGLYVIEGVRLVEEALLAHLPLELVLVAPEQLEQTPRGQALLTRLAEFPTVRVTESVLKSVADTVTPQGVIGVLPIPAQPKNPVLGPLALILDRVRDPGNAGTLLRSADASGVTRTVAFVDSVDAYSPKVVRAGMGAHFRLTILDNLPWASLLPILGSRQGYLAVADDGLPYDQVNWTRDSALIIGGEAEGAGALAEEWARHRVSVPMNGPVESLNAAMAGTIILFEASSQRRESRGSREPMPSETRTPPRPRPAVVVPPTVAASPRPRPAPKREGGPPARRPRNATDRFTRAPARGEPKGERREGDRFTRTPSRGEPKGEQREGPRKYPGTPVGKPEGKPEGKPFRKPVGRSPGKPEGRPSRQPSTNLPTERPPRRSGGKPPRPKL